MARVLLYSINYAPELTGIGKFSGEMGACLHHRGHDVRVVSAPPYYPAWQVRHGYRWWAYRKEYLHGVEVSRCPVWVPRSPSGLTRILHLTSFALSSFPAMLNLAWSRTDWVVMVEPPLFCALAALLTARISGAKCWLHIQDFEVDAAFELGILKNTILRRIVGSAERWLMRRFDVVSSISERMVKRVVSKGVSTERTFLFPNWVDTQRIHPLHRRSVFREELGISNNTVVCLYSGNMGLKQGLDMIIETAKSLSGRSDILFVMCGQGAAFNKLQELAGTLENITWLPLQPEERLNELLNLADIHLLPQQSGAADLVMPSKLTGMLASGRPVIATANPGTEVWDVVENRGLNTTPGDVEAFSKAIVRLVEDPDLMKEYGRAARVFAENRFEKEAILNRFERDLLAADE